MSVSTDTDRTTLTPGRRSLSCQQRFFLQQKRNICISAYSAWSFLQVYFSKLISFVDESLGEVKVCSKEMSKPTFFIQLQILRSVLVVG